MSQRYVVIVAVICILALLAACGKDDPTATPLPPTSTSAPPTATPFDQAHDTPFPPTPTLAPPTNTPVS